MSKDVMLLCTSRMEHVPVSAFWVSSVRWLRQWKLWWLQGRCSSVKTSFWSETRPETEKNTVSSLNNIDRYERSRAESEMLKISLRIVEVIKRFFIHFSQEAKRPKSILLLVRDPAAVFDEEWDVHGKHSNSAEILRRRKFRTFTFHFYAPFPIIRSHGICR